ncbi:hypothetical protein Tco_0775329 [Tanacetum coccineum]
MREEGNEMGTNVRREMRDRDRGRRERHETRERERVSKRMIGVTEGRERRGDDERGRARRDEERVLGGVIAPNLLELTWREKDVSRLTAILESGETDEMILELRGGSLREERDVRRRERLAKGQKGEKGGVGVSERGGSLERESMRVMLREEEIEREEGVREEKKEEKEERGGKRIEEEIRWINCEIKVIREGDGLIEQEREKKCVIEIGKEKEKERVDGDNGSRVIGCFPASRVTRSERELMLFLERERKESSSKKRTAYREEWREREGAIVRENKGPRVRVSLAVCVRDEKER